MRLVLTLALLAILPLAIAGEPAGAQVDDASHDLTVAGWRGAPFVLGTDCPRTDIVRAEAAPHPAGVLVTLAVRDLAAACDGENGPLQGFGFTFNFLTTDGGEGWSEIELVRRGDRLSVDGRWSARCDGRVPLPTTSCDVQLDTPTDAALDVDASTMSFVAPVPWDEASAVWFASVMWDCSSDGNFHVCITGSFVGPGDRAPDLGEQDIR